MDAEFLDFEVPAPHDPNIALQWEYLGEGFSGDYQDDDPDDRPLLRATIYYKGEQVDDASFCTLATTVTPKQELITSALALLASISVTVDSYNNAPRLKCGGVMEGWTWEKYSQ